MSRSSSAIAAGATTGFLSTSHSIVRSSVSSTTQLDRFMLAKPINEIILKRYFTFKLFRRKELVLERSGNLAHLVRSVGHGTGFLKIKFFVTILCTSFLVLPCRKHLLSPPLAFHFYCGAPTARTRRPKRLLLLHPKVSDLHWRQLRVSSRETSSQRNNPSMRRNKPQQSLWRMVAVAYMVLFWAKREKANLQ